MPNVELERSLELKLSDLNREQQLLKSQLDRERLTSITSNLIETITSPKFIENMRQFRSKATAGASFDEAGDLMSLESLRAAGAKIPDDFRLTSRVFEDHESGLKIEIKPPKGVGGLGDLSGGSVAWGACGGAGAAGTCACAGGSTDGGGGAG